MVKISPSNVGGAGSIPDRGAKIPHASRPKNIKNRSNIVTNSIKTLKKCSTSKKRLKQNNNNNRMYLTKFCKKYYNIERTLSLLFILLRGMFLDLIFLEQF